MNDELAELKQRYARLELLYQVSNVIHSTLDPQEALQLILKEATRLTRASSGSVVLINPTTGFLEIEAAHGLPAPARSLKLRVGEGITGWVARTGKPAMVGDVQNDPRYIPLRPNVRSELAVPLDVQGELRGVLNVDSDQPNAFTADDQDLLADLALQAAKAIQNTWLYEQLRQKVRMFETLVSVSQAINGNLNLDDVLNAITREAAMLMGVKMCSLLLLDSAGEWLDLKASYGAGPAYIQKPRLSDEREPTGRGGPPAKTAPGPQRANLRALSAGRSCPQRRAHFVAHRPVALQKRGHRHPQRLHRRAAQFLQRGNPRALRPRRTVGHRHRQGPPLRAHHRRRRAIAHTTKNSPPSACSPPKSPTKYAIR